MRSGRHGETLAGMTAQAAPAQKKSPVTVIPVPDGHAGTPCLPSPRRPPFFASSREFALPPLAKEQTSLSKRRTR